MTVLVHLDTIDEVKEFVSIVSRYEGNVDLKSGRYVVDAKSILGIFSLDISHPLEVDIDMKKSEYEKFMVEIEQYIVQENQ